MVSRLNLDPSTLALKGHNPHNKPIPLFRDFFIFSHFTTLHYTDIFHIDSGFCRQTSTTPHEKNRELWSKNHLITHDPQLAMCNL